MRGTGLVLVPTTLLCMVDACIGGKTAVNVGQVKNLIGTFYPASAVIIDPSFLTSLSKRQLQSGMAEVIKYGLVRDAELFHRLENGSMRCKNKEMVFFEDLIIRCIRCKLEVVQNDLYDTGIRQTLNFGHTIGHAIETMTNFELTHGQAIAIGMCIEAHMSFQKGLLGYNDIMAIYAMFSRYEFPLHHCHGMDVCRIFSLMESDKKSTRSSVRIVCLSSIGSTHPQLLSITKEEVMKALDHLTATTIGPYALL
jgi:3-dehydroquinate synthase